MIQEKLLRLYRITMIFKNYSGGWSVSVSNTIENAYKGIWVAFSG